jgi:Na+/melibiose symporter-like transporter
MPANVARFEMLMYIALAIGVIVMALEFPRLAAIAGAPIVIAIQALLLALTLLLVWLAARRRKNAARWLLLLFFILGLLAVVFGVPDFTPDLGEVLQTNPWVGFPTLAQIVLQALALYYAFTGTARAWFTASAPG